MKNNKANTSVLWGILVAILLIGAIAVPVALSLVDTTPSGTSGMLLKGEEGERYYYGAQQIELTADVYIDHFAAEIHWLAPQVGICNVQAQIQVGDTVGGPGTVMFFSNSFNSDDAPGGYRWDIYYTADSTIEDQLLPAGDNYYIAIKVYCTSFVYQNWGWKDGVGLSMTPPGIAVLGDACIDDFSSWDFNGRYDTCFNMNTAFILGGFVEEEPPDDPDDPPIIPPGDGEPIEPPSIIDTVTEEAEDWGDWWVLIVIGLVIFIATIVILIVLR